jgi:hypothetical protein
MAVLAVEEHRADIARERSDCMRESVACGFSGGGLGGLDFAPVALRALSEIKSHVSSLFLCLNLVD